MTNEEAVKYGTEWLKDEYLDARDGAFIKMALEALRQEPCEDCISREADVREDDVDIAVRTLEQALDRDCERCSRAYGTLGCCTTVNNKWVYSCKEGQMEYLQPKTGRWIKEEKEFIVPSKFYPIQEIVSTCSICNAHYTGTYEDFKYCPNCGTRMEVEE